MGDRPEPIPNEHNCGNDFWLDGMQPDFIVCTLTGWGKGIDWHYMEPPLPNGRYELQWIECGLWIFDDGAIQIVGTLYQGDFMTGILDRIGGGQWLSVLDLADPHYPDFTFIGQFLTWTIGTSVLELYSIGFSRLASWDGAELLGIPKNLDYFAEDQGPGTVPKVQRYSSHKTKSVLHMKGDY